MRSILKMPSDDMPPNERKRALHCDARVWTKLDPCESGTTKKRNHEKAEECRRMQKNAEECRRMQKRGDR